MTAPHRVEDPAYPDVVTVACVNCSPVAGDRSATVEKMVGQVREAGRQGARLVVRPRRR